MATKRTAPETSGERVAEAGAASAALAEERKFDHPASAPADAFTAMEKEHVAARKRNAEAEAEALRINGETNKRVEAYSKRATEESEIRAGLLE